MPSRWKSRLAAAGVTYQQWVRVRAVVAATLPQPCSVCGDLVQPFQRWDLDHLVPLARGGHPLAMSNLGPAHTSCNRRKKHHLAPRPPPHPTAPPSRSW